jgi:KaiC/GvpD/RAD55 family RecA-like ATPase
MERYYRLNETVTGHNIVDEKTLRDEKALGAILSKSPDKDWYTSLYYFTDDLKKFFETNHGKLAGYDGPAFANKLFFDLDNTELDKARKDTIELVHRLQKEGVDVNETCRIYFSGNKGFHVEVALEKQLTPDQLKTICTNIAGDLESFDPVIYNTTRIIRLVNTKHQSSHLYKIELDSLDLTLTVDQIKAKAKNKSELFASKPMKDTAFLDKYLKAVDVKRKPVSVVVSDEDDNGIRGLSDINYERCPKNKPRCIFALEQGVMKSGVGERSAIFLRLAAYYRNQGLTKDVAYNMLKGIARENARLYPEHAAFHKDEIWNTVINSAYSDAGKFKPMTGALGTDPENELLKQYCDAAGKHTNKPCCVHGHLTEDKTTVQIDEVFGSFSNFAENFEKNVVRTGVDFVDEHMKITTGTTSLLVGAAGSGKTTLSLNMMEKANSFDQQTMFFSMDMHKNLIYLKLAQKLTPYSQKEIFAFHKNKDAKKIQEIKAVISQHYAKTFFDFSGTLTFEQMRDKIFDVEQKTGKKIKLVVADYASRISSPHSDAYASARHNALKSKEIADVTDAAWVILSQISRNVGDGCTPIRTKRAAKESGDWEESATNVITVWRPFMGHPQWDDVMRIYLAKNRMGKELETVLQWNGAKGIIADMDPLTLEQYNHERGDKAEREYLKSKFSKT